MPKTIILTFNILLLSLIIFLSCESRNQIRSDVDKFNSSLDQNNKPRFDKGVYCGLMDSEGFLWFGSRGNGIYRYDGKSFVSFSENDGLCDNEISSIMEDKKGNLWFGTTNGLCHFDKKSFTNIAIPYSDTSSVWLDKVYPIVNPNQVMSLLEDKQGFIWVGTNGAGVYRYDQTVDRAEYNAFTQYLSRVGMVYEDGLHHNIVLSITEDLMGNIWFTSLSHAGVNRFDGETFREFQEEDGLSDDFIRTSYCDRAGNMWIGTHGNHNGGLDYFDGNSFVQFHEEDGLCSNNVHSIYEDGKGRIWLGSGIGNLCIYDGETFKEFADNKGQKFRFIQIILEDKFENIWFGGKEGLWKYDGESVIDMTASES